MSDQLIDIDRNEILVRAFFRLKESDQESRSNLIADDFARNMTRHSGISLFRQNLITKKEIIGRLKSKKLIGFATCNAGQFIDLGFQPMADPKDAAHLSCRCQPCDLCTNQVEGPLCTPKQDPKICQLSLEAETDWSVLESLVNIFTVHTPAI